MGQIENLEDKRAYAQDMGFGFCELCAEVFIYTGSNDAQDHPCPSRPRVIDPTKHNITKYAGVDLFLKKETIPPGYQIIVENGLPIDVIAQNRGSDTTVVFFQGAIDKTWTLPAFGGMGVSKDVPVNRVFISDPSLVLTDRLNLGWFVGNSRMNTQQHLLAIIRHIADVWGDQRLVFFGASGGGFASLFFSAHFPGSLAIVSNPQTDIAKYELPAVERFAEVCYGVTGEDPMSQLPDGATTNLVDLYRTPRGNTVAYMQNSADFDHVEDHLNPFLAASHPENKIYVLMGEWGEGHVAPPKDVHVQALSVAASQDWADGFSKMGFVPAASN
ncbi:hypothetical protein [Arthrobacter sp. fls2-241-R2A-200]|uniref:hypothetical protein n=1 Tax=Arthrobacter sp. fls2-241-R2A-200 TaxID=3040281 RepID=UPI00254BE266|nr:hypothetical protein [Arthrobacter sp. fls2-241-R2A-200]